VDDIKRRNIEYTLKLGILLKNEKVVDDIKRRNTEHNLELEILLKNEKKL
jgi:hypothetical protein